MTLKSEEYKNDLSSQAMRDERFYCGVYLLGKEDMIGYVAFNDTSRNLWEVVIELDSNYRFQGIGGEPIELFTNAVSQITGKHQFFGYVEYDNAASRKMLEKLNAKILGVANILFPSLDDAETYEEKHLDEITEDMRQLAQELEVEPRQLLSHVLEYNIRIKE